jgi:hypothetical protein
VQNTFKIKDFGERVCLNLEAKKESDLSFQESLKYFPASDKFISGMIELAHQEAIDSFQDFYEKVSQDPEEMEEDLSFYRKLVEHLNNMEMDDFDILYRSADTFIRQSIPQPVMFFKTIYSAFVDRK